MVPRTSPEGDHAANGFAESRSPRAQRTDKWSGVGWSTGLADDSKRQTRYLPGFHAMQRNVSQGTAREELEDVRDDIKLSSEKTCSSKMWVTKHRYVVVTCGPTVDAEHSDTTSAVGLRCS